MMILFYSKAKKIGVRQPSSVTCVEARQASIAFAQQSLAAATCCSAVATSAATCGAPKVERETPGLKIAIN